MWPPRRCPSDGNRAVPLTEAQMVVPRSASEAERRGAFAFWRYLMEVDNIERWVMASFFLPVRRSAAERLEPWYQASPERDAGFRQLEDAVFRPRLGAYALWQLHLEEAHRAGHQGASRSPRGARGGAAAGAGGALTPSRRHRRSRSNPQRPVPASQGHSDSMGEESTMPVVDASIVIHQPQEAVFLLTQDYDLRLEWDPFLRDIRFLDGAREADLGVRVWVKAWTGLTMTVTYISLQRPDVVAVKMVEGAGQFSTSLPAAGASAPWTRPPPRSSSATTSPAGPGCARSWKRSSSASSGET